MGLKFLFGLFSSPKTEKDGSEENEWKKEAEVFKDIEKVCDKHGIAVIIPIQTKINEENNNTVEK